MASATQPTMQPTSGTRSARSQDRRSRSVSARAPQAPGFCSPARAANNAGACQGTPTEPRAASRRSRAVGSVISTARNGRHGPHVRRAVPRPNRTDANPGRAGDIAVAFTVAALLLESRDPPECACFVSRYTIWAARAPLRALPRAVEHPGSERRPASKRGRQKNARLRSPGSGRLSQWLSENAEKARPPTSQRNEWFGQVCGVAAEGLPASSLGKKPPLTQHDPAGRNAGAVRRRRYR